MKQVLLLMACGWLLGGCSSPNPSSGEAPSPNRDQPLSRPTESPQQRKQRLAAAAEEKRRLAAQAKANQLAQEKADRLAKESAKKRSKEIKSYIHDGFKETSWYGFIQDIEVQGKTITVRTNIPYVARSDSMRSVWESEAKGICSGVSGYAYSSQNESKGLKSIKVLASGGQPYMNRTSVDDDCAI